MIMLHFRNKMALPSRDNHSYRTVVWWTFLVLYAMPVSSGNNITDGQVWTTRQLDNFFPVWQDDLRNALKYNCSAELQHDREKRHWLPYGTVECLIKTFSEIGKAEMAASSVLLGLLPVFLSQLGPSTIEQSLLHLRQPLLALLVAIGSPSVNGLQNAEYIDALRQRLSTSSANTTLAEQSANYKVMITLVAQYTMVLFAVTNVAILAYQLSVWAVTLFSLGFVGLPAIWIALAGVIHFVRIAAFYFKFNVNPAVPFRLRQVLVPGRREGKIVLHERLPSETIGKIGQILVWILYLATCLHTVLGTVSLSGLVFIAMRDSFVVLIRFLVNAIICKLIFALEAAGIEENITLEREGRLGDAEYKAERDEDVSSPLVA
jgi:hypothetical protein